MKNRVKAYIAAQQKLFSSLVIAALTLALSLAGAVIPAQLASAGTMTTAEWAGWVGGTGGDSSFTWTCGSDSVVTGFKTYTYSNPNHGMGMVCNRINADGSVGAQTWAPGSGTVVSNCPTGMAVVGIYAFGAPANVGVYCQTPPNKLNAVERVGPSGNPSQTPTCSGNGFVNRIYGKTGAWFDGFQIGCVTLSGYPSAVVASSNSAPTGTLTVGSTLTSASTFQGLPTPTVVYTWEKATSISGPWVQISGANASTYQTGLADAGYLIRLVATGTNTTNSVTNTVVSTSPATAAIGLASLSTPDLKASSDSGTSNTDNLTNDVTPGIDISGITTGATVTVTAVKAGSSNITCSFIAMSSTGTCDLPSLVDGTWTVTANQAFNGSPSAASSALNLQIDSTGPLATSIDAAANLTTPNKVDVTVTFSETPASVDATKFYVAGTSTTWVRGAVSLSGNTATFSITSTNVTNGTLLVTVGAGAATDSAGNQLTEAASITETANTSGPTASLTPRSTIFSSSTLTYDVVFNKKIFGLDLAADFSVNNTGSAGCSKSSMSAVNAGVSYSVVVSCTGQGTVALTLASNSVADKTAILGPTTATTSVVSTRDTSGATITSISKTLVGTTINYLYTFSESISAFPASAITVNHTRSGGNSGWTVTEPVRTAVANQWSFAVSNIFALNGD